MIDLHLIGIGTGNPDHLTMAAIRAMNGADLILLPRKGGEGDGRSDLVDLRRVLCGAVLTRPVRVVEFDLPARAAEGPYIEAVRDWHAAIAAAWRAEIDAHLPRGGKLALLVWGDPSLYDSTLRIAARLQREGLDLRTHVVPGISSVQLLTAAHAIPLNTLASSVTITTGRRLRERGWPEGADTLVVMLDGGCAFETLPPEGIEIWWGAFLGLPQEALVSGALAEAGPRIAPLRAMLREKHGWIMDIYLLRRPAGSRS
ncbi:precorrin-6A synthase (deacetylating) [Novosphingobium sp. KA1]|uniref:precorrin-6A synthase (deacetylating) n=1 Tax=Novosphingobium sp. (strain KA1) TaxID=164608 RepID=UPI001A9082A9|nr:precorrin-6A synthase (deacetylating) [Novosphingobium sp. KA1]QSR19781.1 precorrin-6A synthase (deacetylating) [Novosphingobium sp. KA1]